MMGKNLGQRKSVKRELIYDIIKTASGPLSVNDILNETEKRSLPIGIATIYRTIKMLTDEAKIKQINLPDGQPRYTIKTAECRHHFHCKSCNSVMVINHPCNHIHDEEVDGHKVDGHDITLNGICKNCR